MFKTSYVSEGTLRIDKKIAKNNMPAKAACFFGSFRHIGKVTLSLVPPLGDRGLKYLIKL